MRARRAAAFGVALACTALASTQVRGEDPPKAAPPRPCVLQIEADKEYRFSFTETVHETSHVTDRAGESDRERKAETTWLFTVKFAEMKPGVGTVVTMALTSVKGWYEDAPKPRDDFDSSKWKGFTEPMRVTLSPRGQVLEVTGAVLDKLVEKEADPDAAQVARRALVERFFQTLPPTPVRVGTKWEDRRVAAAGNRLASQYVLGAYEESAVVKKAGSESFAASLAAKGSNKVARRRIDEDPKRKAAAYEVLEDWSVTGECEVAADTGLARLRTTHQKMSHYLDVWSGRNSALDLSVITRSTYEIDTRLELLPPK